MKYQAKIREIQRNFIMGYQDRETCLREFETVLHEYGLLPADENLDRTITNDNFIGLLRMAMAHKEPKSNRDPEVSAEDGAVMEYVSPTEMQERYRLTDSILHRCPVCHKQANQGLYNRVQGMDGEAMPVDPPRCHNCMTKWAEEHFGDRMGSTAAKKETPNFSLDSSTVIPHSPTEEDFFKQYEKEMEGFKP